MVFISMYSRVVGFKARLLKTSATDAGDAKLKDSMATVRFPASSPR